MSDPRPWKRGISEEPDPSRRWHFYRDTNAVPLCGNAQAQSFGYFETATLPALVDRCRNCQKKVEHGVRRRSDG